MTHPMIRELKELRGNSRACVLTEPLWGIPHTLYLPFASVYMLALGLSDVQVGAVASVSLLVRALVSIISGAVTDKLGRKRTTMIFDIVSWSIPCVMWALARDATWFFAAAALNGLWQITDNSWTCLLVEDADKREIVHIYSWIYVSGQLSVFFAPISAMLVSGMGIVSAMRGIYLFSFVSMTAKFILLHKYSSETRIGRERFESTKGRSLLGVLSEYKKLAPRFFASGDMRLATALSVLLIAANTVMDSFFGIYATQRLSVPDHYLSYFPMIRSAIMLAFLFVVQPRIYRFGFKSPMLIGVCLYVASHLALISSLGERLPAVAVAVAYTLLQACAHCLVMPRKDSLVALLIDPGERARMTSVLTLTVLTVTIPFGYLAGYLSDIDRRLPFLMNAALFAAIFAIILASKRLGRGGAPIDS